MKKIYLSENQIKFIKNKINEQTKEVDIAIEPQSNESYDTTIKKAVANARSAGLKPDQMNFVLDGSDASITNESQETLIDFIVKNYGEDFKNCKSFQCAYDLIDKAIQETGDDTPMNPQAYREIYTDVKNRLDGDGELMECYTKGQLKEARLRKLQNESVRFTKKQLEQS